MGIENNTHQYKGAKIVNDCGNFVRGYALSPQHTAQPQKNILRRKVQRRQREMRWAHTKRM